MSSVDKLSSIVSRLFFFAAFVLLVLAVAERLANFFGYTILREAYAAGRLLEFAAVLLIFVVALTLRQLRNEMRNEARPN